MQPDIIIVENGITTSDKKEVAEKLNHFFIEAVDNFEIEPYLRENNPITEDIQDIIDKCKNHPSIKIIKENIKVENKFSFKDTTPQELETQIQNLDTKKAIIENDILPKTNDIVSNHLSNFFNKSKNEQDYPTLLKNSRCHSIAQKG